MDDEKMARYISCAEDLMSAAYTARDQAYTERNRLVSWLARCYPSGIAKTDIEGWMPEWHNCVYIDLPTGQVSWHYHDRDNGFFIGLPPYRSAWDGHTTEQKYERLAALWDGFAMAQNRHAGPGRESEASLQSPQPKEGEDDL